MMKIILLVLVISAVLFVKSCNGEEGYTVNGNHWLNDGIVPKNKDKLKLFTDTLENEFEQLFKLQDAAAMAEKYTHDCVYIREDIGIMRGKVAVQNGYQKMYDSGIARVKLELLEETDIGNMGTGYMHIIFKEHFFDKDNNEVGETKVLGVLKLVGDGFQTYLKAEITEKVPEVQHT
ncbi:uncharacterized protein [Amphiura filiformis]|uniref:uncharacterized protein n=1 Tax=Amphiura filiformis TaxID=82378 RepID=UPI003B2110E1